MFLSVFDVFKIGIGPSSSHTMGPMTAANRFLDEIRTGDWPRPRNAVVASLKASLHGSLAFTGIGHGTGRAVVLGLCGLAPDSVDPDRIDALVAAVEDEGVVHPEGHPAYRFRPALDLVYDRKERLPGHTNGLQFFAYDADGTLLLRRSLLFDRRWLRGQRSRTRTRCSCRLTERQSPTPLPTPLRCWPWPAALASPSLR